MPRSVFVPDRRGYIVAPPSNGSPMSVLPRGVVIANAAILALAITAVTLAARNERQASANAGKRVVAAAQAFLGTLDARAAQQGQYRAEREVAHGLVESSDRHRDAGWRQGPQRPQDRRHDPGAGEGRDGAARRGAESRRIREGEAIVDADEFLQQHSGPTRQATRACALAAKSFTSRFSASPSRQHVDAAVWRSSSRHQRHVCRRCACPHADAHRRATGELLDRGQNVRPLGDENDKAFALMNASHEEQRKQAMLGAQVRNLALGPGEDGKTIAPEGVKGSASPASKRAQLLDLIGEWVRISATKPLPRRWPRSSPISTRRTLRGRDRRRRQPRVLQDSGTGGFHRVCAARELVDNTDHIHTIYRDPTNDYARKPWRDETAAATLMAGLASRFCDRGSRARRGTCKR